MSQFELIVLCLLIPLSLANVLRERREKVRKFSETFSGYGQNCETPYGELGTCVPIRSCEGAFELELRILKNGEENFKEESSFLQKSFCGLLDEKPLICCKKAQVKINPIVYNHLEKMNCGVSSSTRVSKGEMAGLLEFRWMALLKYVGNVPFACAGTLIDDRHVLTAAHCLHNFTNLPIAVRLGEYNITSDPDCLKYGKRMKCLDPVQDIAIEKYIIHEDYIYKGIYDDLAILRLERPVNFTKSVRPICLPLSKKLQYEIPAEFFTAGWGETEFGNRSDVLLWTSLPNRSPDYCESSLGVSLSEEHVCAGGTRFRDTCKGDSGGPIFFPNFYVDGVTRAIQYGIVSFGIRECGRMSLPAIYMNVPYYMQWITDHLDIEDSDSQHETQHEHPRHHDHNHHHHHHQMNNNFEYEKPQEEDSSIHDHPTNENSEPIIQTTTTTTTTEQTIQSSALSINDNSILLTTLIVAIFPYYFARLPCNSRYKTNLFRLK